MNDVKGAPPGHEDAFTLSAAQEAVLSAIETARASRALDDAAISELTSQVGEIRDVYALDGLVRSTPALDAQICRLPGCFHPPQPPGKSKPFAYCDVVRDAHGKPKHTPTRAMRLRDWLAGGALPQSAPVTDDPSGERPVSLARMSIPDQITRVEQVAEQLGTQLASSIDALRKQVALVGDDEARLVEIESVRYDEARKVEEARGAQLAAEKAARKARQSAEAAEQARVEAIEAAEEANARADHAEQTATEQADRDAQVVAGAQAAAEVARAEAETAIAEATTKIQEAATSAAKQVADAQNAAAASVADAETAAQQRIETAESDAQARIRAAEQSAEQEIARIQEEAATAIAAAQAEAQNARSAAESAADQMRAAQEDAAEARWASARDEAAAAAAREELANVRADRDRLQERLDAAESRYRTELGAANARLDALQTRLDDNQRLHQDELRRLATERTAERTQDEARATAQLESIQSAHAGQVESLNERIGLIQAELTRARSAGTRPETPERGSQ